MFTFLPMRVRHCFDFYILFQVLYHHIVKYYKSTTDRRLKESVLH